MVIDPVGLELAQPRDRLLSARVRNGVHVAICIKFIPECVLRFFLSVTKTDVIDVAEKALQSLKRVRAGMTAEKKRGEKGRKRVRQQMSELFTSKKKALTSKSRPAWKHRFICLAYRDQARIPTTDAEKDELYEAGLHSVLPHCMLYGGELS